MKLVLPRSLGINVKPGLPSYLYYYINSPSPTPTPSITLVN